MQNKTLKSKNDQPNILLLCADCGTLTWQLINGLRATFPQLQVIMETQESKKIVIKRRLRKLGLLYVIGMLGHVFFMRMFRSRSKKRLNQIIEQFNLDATPVAEESLTRISSLNAPEAIDLVKSKMPDVVAVFGTRILSKNLISSVTVPMINYHAGITPNYRGQQPAYWALVARDAENAGITIHEVISGVDKGAVLYQEKSNFSASDTIATHQQFQMGHAIPLLVKAINDGLQGRMAPRAVNGDTGHYFPPTLWRYLYNGFTKGVW